MWVSLGWMWRESTIKTERSDATDLQTTAKALIYPLSPYWKVKPVLLSTSSVCTIFKVLIRQSGLFVLQTSLSSQEEEMFPAPSLSFPAFIPTILTKILLVFSFHLFSCEVAHLFPIITRFPCPTFSIQLMNHTVLCSFFFLPQHFARSCSLLPLSEDLLS